MIEVQGEEISNRVAVLDAIEPIDGPGPNDVIATAPEPGSMFLLGSGLLGLAAAARRRLRRTAEE